MFLSMGQIETVCLQNNITEIYFIMDRSELYLVFTVCPGMAQILTDSTTGSKKN